jgi:thiosulfate dehydrogenase (quinone) large subunit
MEASATKTPKDITVAYLLLRMTLGVNICVHGISRIIGGPSAFAHSLVTSFQKTLLPAWAVFGFGLVLPWLEAILGLSVLTGLRTAWL